MLGKPRFFSLALLVLSVLSLSTHFVAQPKPQINGPVDDASRVAIAGSRHPLALPEFDIGSLDPTLAMERVLLVLAPPQEQKDELAAFLRSQHDKSSPNYHRWVTPDEFAQRFGLAAQDVEAVKQWLQKRGFTVTSVAKSGRWIEFSGRVGEVESAFHTPMRQYRIGEQVHLANSQDISVPQALSPVVRGVASLHNFFKRPMLARFGQFRPDGNGAYAQVDPAVSSSSGLHALGPADFAKIYEVPFNPGIPAGAGQTIAIVARSVLGGFDVTDFRQAFGLTFRSPIVTITGVVNPAFDPTSGDSAEATLDTEWAWAVARDADINVVASGSTLTTDGVDLSSAYIVENNVADIMSVSFGACERDMGTAANAFYEALWQQAAAQGISVFVASGDNGSAGCDDPGGNLAGTVQAVSGLASTPFNTAVGGTQFNEGVNTSRYWSSTNGPGFLSALGYIPEAVWNESCGPGTVACPAGSGVTVDLFAGSGGASSLYSKTDAPWQNVNGVPVGDGQRDIPDVSLTAAGHDPYLICFNNSCSGPNPSFFGVGGTSASSPAFAGIMALINQAAGGRQGLANYLFYQLAGIPVFGSCDSSLRTNPATNASGCVFFDITTGTNRVPGVTGFSAVAGYDKATGLGSAGVTNLIANWLNALSPRAATTTVISPSSIAGTHGSPVNLNIQVSSANTNAPPTGTVSLTTSLTGQTGKLIPGGSVVLTSSAFSGQVFDLPGGTYTLTAHYAGDAGNRGSDSSPVTVSISPEASTVAASSLGINSAGTAVVSTSTFTYGGFMNLHAAVAGASGHGFASGAVSFLDGATPVASSPLNQKGEADVFFFGTFGPTALTVGPHGITASYGGDASFSAGSSAVLNVTITKANPGLGITPLWPSIRSGHSDDMLVGVTGTGPISPTGTVQLFDGATPIGSPVPVSGGGARAPVTLIADGIHNISFAYSGDSVYNPGNSASAQVVVEPPIFFSLNGPGSVTVPAGQTATYSLSVSADALFSGTVSIACNGAPAGTTCTPNPASVNFPLNSTGVPLTVTVTTTQSARLGHHPLQPLSYGLAALLGIALCSGRKRRGKHLLFVAVLCVTLMSGCGGGSSNVPPPPRPPTTATLTIVGTGGGHTASFPLSLTITH